VYPGDFEFLCFKIEEEKIYIDKCMPMDVGASVFSFAIGTPISLHFFSNCNIKFLHSFVPFSPPNEKSSK
jgi:hypothetical protein